MPVEKNKSNLNPSKIDNDKVMAIIKNGTWVTKNHGFYTFTGGMMIWNEKNKLVCQKSSELMNLKPPWV